MSDPTPRHLPLRWGILFPREYRRTQRMIVRDWLVLGASMVVGSVGLSVLLG